MIKIKQYSIIVTAIILFSCNQSANLSEEKKLAIIKEIQQRLDGYPEAAKRGDTLWFHNFWADVKEFTFAGDGQILTDYETTITKPYRESLSKMKEILYFKYSNGHGYVLDEDAVSYVTNFDWGMQTKSGDTLRAKGAWLYVFKKLDNQWKVVHSAGTHKYY